LSLVSGSVPNLISGVSQQAFALRLASQAEESVNGYPSVVMGLDKRPGTEHVAKLSSAVPDSTFLHVINRDSAERYVVVVHSGNLSVYAFDGSPRTVNFPNGKGYLSGADFSAVTVADFTFLVNRSVVTAMDGTLQPNRTPEALVSVRVGNYSTTYTVYVTATNGQTITASHTTAATGADAVKTEAIANQIGNIINTAGQGFQANQTGSTLHIYRPDGLDFTIATTDSYADQALLSLKGKVQSAALLPTRGVAGFQLEIEGSPGNRYDNYFVEYRVDGGSETAGVWKEIPKPTRQIRFNAATMPHVLVREADGSFTFRQAQWSDCRAGDENTNPVPGIIGLPVADVFFYRNRLGLIGGEQVLFSKNGEFFDFWRETATTILETDPIDVAVSHVKVSNLRHAVPFNEALLLFSDQTQFTIPPGDALTPATIAINQSTEFEASLRARPIGLGPYVYFGAPRGGFTSVREYFIDGNTRAGDSTDITAHCPNYIHGEILDMAGSSTENMIAVLASGNRSSLWVYKFQFAQQEKVQSGWGRWDFAPTDRLLAVEFIRSALYLLIARPDGLFLERMDMDPGRTMGSLPFVPRLDRLCGSTRWASAGFDGAKTWVELGYAEDGPLQVMFTADTVGFRAGQVITPTRPSSTRIEFPGEAAGECFVVGRQYEMRHTFSPFLVRVNAPGGGTVASTEGRLQIGTASLYYTDSGYFRVEVTPFRRRTFWKVFSGRVVGSARTLLGQSGLETGKFDFAVRSNNLNVKVDLVNDSPLPSRFLNLEWEGDYSPRTRRVD